MTLLAPVATSTAPAAPEWVGPALRGRDFLLSRWPWRALAFVATSTVGLLPGSVLLALAVVPALVALDPSVTASQVLPVLALTVPVAAALSMALAPLVSRLDVWRAALVDRRPLPGVLEPRGFVRRWNYRLTERTAWLRVAYLATSTGLALVALPVLAAVGILAGVLLLSPLLVHRGLGPVAMGPWQISTVGEATVAVLPGVAMALASVYLCGAVAAGQVALMRLLLQDVQGSLENELRLVTRSRSRLAHDFDDERRRIERDLHDGAQQRVVALAMQLGIARMDLEAQLGDDHDATRLVVEAHEQAKKLLEELRDFIRGIHPKVLTDVGLAAAVDQLAATSPVPVDVRDELGVRPARHVESTLYFCVTEALANAVRHGGATRVTVTLRRQDGQHGQHGQHGQDGRDERVVVEVHDDGRGGADPARGSGLQGIANRAAVIDGTVSVTSPSGGPTVVRVSVPDRPEETA